MSQETIQIPEFLQICQGIYQLGEGITLEWLHDGEIAVFDMPHSDNNAAVDVYINAYINLIENWKPQKPLLIMVASNNPDANFTPYMRKRFGEITAIRNTRQVYGRFALVIHQGFLARIFRTYINTYNRRSLFKSNLFFTREEGLTWLEEILQQAD